MTGNIITNLTAPSTSGIYVSWGNNVFIDSNTIDGTSGSAFLLRTGKLISDVVITNNTVRMPMAEYR